MYTLIKFWRAHDGNCFRQQLLIRPVSVLIDTRQKGSLRWMRLSTNIHTHADRMLSAKCNTRSALFIYTVTIIINVVVIENIWQTKFKHSVQTEYLSFIQIKTFCSMHFVILSVTYKRSNNCTLLVLFLSFQFVHVISGILVTVVTVGNLTVAVLHSLNLLKPLIAYKIGTHNSTNFIALLVT